MDPRDIVGRIYKEDHYTLLYKQSMISSSGPCGFGEEHFFMVFPIVSLWELSLAMETTILIQSTPKPKVVNPHTQ